VNEKDAIKFESKAIFSTVMLDPTLHFSAVASICYFAPRGLRSIVMSMSVCLSVRSHKSTRSLAVARMADRTAAVVKLTLTLIYPGPRE